MSGKSAFTIVFPGGESVEVIGHAPIESKHYFKSGEGRFWFVDRVLPADNVAFLKQVTADFVETAGLFLWRFDVQQPKASTSFLIQ